MGISWELDRREHSWALPLLNLGVGSAVCLNKSSRCLDPAHVWELLLYSLELVNSPCKRL